MSQLLNAVRRYIAVVEDEDCHVQSFGPRADAAYDALVSAVQAEEQRRESATNAPDWRAGVAEALRIVEREERACESHVRATKGWVKQTHKTAAGLCRQIAHELRHFKLGQD